jgi:hypothetical protein
VDPDGSVHGFDAACRKRKGVGEVAEESLDVPLVGTNKRMNLPLATVPLRLADLRDSTVGVAVLADGRELLRTVRPGAQFGVFDLLPFLSMGERENDVELLRFYPVADRVLSVF